MGLDRPVTTARFLLAISEATELATPTLARHQTRVAFLAWRMGEAAGLDFPELERLFFAALIHDIGALTPEEKVFIREQALSPAEVVRHCRLGERLLADSPVLAPLSPLVARHHTPLPANATAGDGDGADFDAASILHFAELFEHLLDSEAYILAQRAAITERLRELAPTLAGPRTLDLFRAVSGPEAFWLDMVSAGLPAWLAEYSPFGRRPLDNDAVWSLGETFLRVIDFRSPFTATHSAGVLTAASELARLHGFGEDEVRWMRLAGALHDIGKMAVPDSILEKPGPLTPAEMDVMRRHTYHTARILGNAGLERATIEWAAYHHERLDGRGYPFREKGESLGLGSRVMVVADIFTALAEDRPYRAGLPRGRVVELLRGMAAGGAVDEAVVARLEENYDALWDATRAAQARARERYQADNAAVEGEALADMPPSV